jgi:hypothetical protein
MTLVIRTAQERAIAAARFEAFVARMVAMVSAQSSTADNAVALKPETAETFVRAQIAAAQRYGIVSARDLKTYIACALAFGPRFDADPQRPWAAAVLADADLSGSEKAEVLEQYLVFR